MKKALAILTALAVIGGNAVFADVADIAVSGNATLTWGMDFETEASGFKNEADWTVKIPLLATKDFVTKGEGDAYAEIEIDDAEFYFVDEENDDTSDYTADYTDGWSSGDQDVDGITAKLFFGNVYAVIVNDCQDDAGTDGGPSFTSDNANIWSPISDDSWDDDDTGVNLDFTPGPAAAGFRLGYKTEMFDVSAKLGSKASYTTTTEDDQSKYAFGIDVTATPSDMISVGATFNNAMWDGTNADSIMSFGGAVEVKPVTDLTLNAGIDAGNDYVANGDDVIAWDAIVSAKYASLLEAGAYVASASSDGAAGINADGEAATDLAVYVKLMDNDMVENLDFSVTVMAMHLLSDADATAAAYGVDEVTAPIAFGATVSYKYATNDVNYFKPYAEVYGQNMSGLAEDVADIVYCYEAGVVYGLFSNCTITAKMAAGGYNDDAMSGYGFNNVATPIEFIETAAGGASDNDAGRFTLACKVTY